ncbi:uncharacterized protein LOC116843559 [Odontomachus brunneus]|uniref:uncharacterized protein LOC116843559 n=1 Tax=Odontomachus brunneus TaxID=486640 RepID=UPI0013F1FDA2|nr:uncharacterized protein LOC116843559 [Odontomachus brunneus]
MSTRRCYLCEKKADANKNISLHRFPKERQLRSKWLNVCKLSEADDVSKVYICSWHFKDEDYRKKEALGKYVGNWLLPGAVPSISVPNISTNIQQVYISDEAVKYQDIGDLENILSEEKMISNDMNNEPATIVDVEMKSQPSTLLKEIAKPKDNDNISYVSTGKNRNNNKIYDDTEGFKQEYICTPKKRISAEPRFISEICVSDVATPRKAKWIIEFVKRNNAKKQKQIHKLHRQKRKLLKRIAFLQDMVKHLEQKGLMSENAGESLIVKY